tara:strand:+ start:1431 stop:2303 length:873 start_codon:yes stop_codon:yes gene_type:complete
MTIKQLGGVFGRNPTFNDVTIEGELTFDGDIDINSDLKVDGDLDVTGTATFTGEIEANGGIALADNDTATFGASDDLQIYHDGNDSYIKDAGTGNLKIGGANVLIETGGGTKYLEGGSNVLRLYHTGNQKMQTTAVGIAVTGTVTADGIGFSNAPSASELLDDYEEGTWTPTVGGDATYYVQDGYYVKVGTLVYVQGKIQVNVLGTGSATTVSGLPFTALNAALSSAGTGSSSYFGTIATNVTTLVPYVNNATATVIFGSLGAAGGIMTGVTTVFQNSARVDFSLSYRSV